MPPEREMMLSSAEVRKRMRESITALRTRYKDFGVSQFLQNVHDSRVTWTRGVTAGGRETRALGPGKPKPIEVCYVSDMTPANEDGCGRSLGDRACRVKPEPFPLSERLQNPRTLNHHSMLGACATYEGINTSFLYVGSVGSHLSWHVEDNLLQSTSYLQSGANKFWFFVARSEVPKMVRVISEHMDPFVLVAAGGDVWTFLAEKAVLWPASLFLAHGVRVGFHKMEVGDFVVTGYGVLHSGFKAGTNVASAVRLACPGWLAHAIEHEARWRGKIGMLIPFENLLILSALKLAAGKWWFGGAKSYEACDPAEF